MLECLKFIFQQVANFCSMLFSINLDNGLSLGLIMCIIFILLPVSFRVLTIISHSVLNELDYVNEDKSLIRRRKK